MKKIYLMLICLSSPLVASTFYQISVTDIEKTPLKHAFLLKHRNNLGDVILDCHSFLHGLTLDADNPNSKFFHLYTYECHEIHKFLKKGIDRQLPSCLSVDFTYMSYSLERRDLDCY